MPKGARVPGASPGPSRSFQRFSRLTTASRTWAIGFFLIVVSLLGSGRAWGQTDVVSEISVTGNRRIPADTIRARIFTKAGDIYDAPALERDFNSLWNTGYFEDIKFSREQTPKGWRIIVQVKEKPTIREILYLGTSSVSNSDILDRFKQDKVGLVVESQYDPTRIKKAEVSIKGLLSEHGRQFATIRTEVRQIPPAAVGITFVVKEGPKVKVGKIKFEGNQEHQDAHFAVGDEEPASRSACRTRSSWRIFLPRPTTPRNWKKIPSASAPSTRTADISKSW